MPTVTLFSTIQLLILIVNQLSSTVAFVPGLYCGLESCYDVLGVSSDTPKNELAKIYRKLAKLYHPDRAKGEKAKLEAEEKFRLVATAYETLKDDESRADYDYMLEHPEERYYHYYQYYKRRVSPKIDVRIVIFITVFCISIVQYLSAHHKYNQAIDYLMTQHKYRLRAKEVAKERNLFDGTKMKGKRKRDKASEKDDQETIIRSIIEENIDIKGGYKKPSIWNTLIWQIICLPYSTFAYIRWWSRWIWRYIIKREEYDDDARMHLIRKNLQMSQTQFDSVTKVELSVFMDAQLWIKEKFEVWKKQKEEEEKQKLCQSGKYKQYRRYIKNQGPGQISFLDDE